MKNRRVWLWLCAVLIFCAGAAAGVWLLGPAGTDSMADLIRDRYGEPSAASYRAYIGYDENSVPVMEFYQTSDAGELRALMAYLETIPVKYRAPEKGEAYHLDTPGESSTILGLRFAVTHKGKPSGFYVDIDTRAQCRSMGDGPAWRLEIEASPDSKDVMQADFLIEYLDPLNALTRSGVRALATGW